MPWVDALCDGGRMTNLDNVKTIYEAFGRGDVPAILERLADDITWEYQPISTDVPWLQARKGRTGAAGFFQSLAEMQIRHFAVKQLLASDRLVVALVDIEFDVVKTGKSVREVDEVHLWHFDDHGRVARFRHVTDTHQHQLAWRGQA
ncbi:MAG: nuclear transport factor 2 family protein [Deltaproteobacteria bacterium]|nr:nuclear transport factor 2 family protein [Deltaproteobacteria bacterium]